MARRTPHLALIAAALLGWAEPTPAVTVEYLHSLSTLDGFVPFSGAPISFDPLTGELYVFANGRVRVFNDSGMEVFTMGDTPEVGVVVSVAGTEDGELVALSYRAGVPGLIRCNFRGELIARIEPAGVPPELAAFRADVMRYHARHIYLADLSAMRIVVLAADGRFEKAFDAAALLGVAERREQVGLKGFNVDRAGNMLFTVQPLFRAFVLGLDGTLRGFGQRGSAPGKFNVVGGIAADERGYFYVADILKSAILVFDETLRFVNEFGYRADGGGGLTAPFDVAAGDGKVFVSQYARRGVSVFKVEGAPVKTGEVG